MNSSRPVSQSPTPMRAPPAPSTATPPPIDPFASLVSASPRQSSSPFQAPAQTPPASSSLLDLVGGPAPQTAPAPAPAAEDDEWNFASSLPASNALPSANKIQVLNSELRVDFAARRVPNQPRQIHVMANFSNNTSQPIGELHFQVAVEKVSFTFYVFLHTANILQSYKLQLRPQSGRDIAPQQQNGVQQEMLMDGIDVGKGDSVKIRFRVSYKLGGEAREEQGMVPPLGIA